MYAHLYVCLQSILSFANVINFRIRCIRRGTSKFLERFADLVNFFQRFANKTFFKESFLEIVQSDSCTTNVDSAYHTTLPYRFYCGLVLGQNQFLLQL